MLIEFLLWTKHCDNAKNKLARSLAPPGANNLYVRKQPPPNPKTGGCPKIWKNIGQYPRSHCRLDSRFTPVWGIVLHNPMVPLSLRSRNCGGVRWRKEWLFFLNKPSGIFFNHLSYIYLYKLYNLAKRKIYLKINNNFNTLFFLLYL